MWLDYIRDDCQRNRLEIYDHLFDLLLNRHGHLEMHLVHLLYIEHSLKYNDHLLLFRHNDEHQDADGNSRKRKLNEEKLFFFPKFT